MLILLLNDPKVLIPQVLDKRHRTKISSESIFGKTGSRFSFSQFENYTTKLLWVFKGFARRRTKRPLGLDSVPGKNRKNKILNLAFFMITKDPKLKLPDKLV